MANRFASPSYSDTKVMKLALSPGKRTFCSMKKEKLLRSKIDLFVWNGYLLVLKKTGDSDAFE